MEAERPVLRPDTNFTYILEILSFPQGHPWALEDNGLRHKEASESPRELVSCAGSHIPPLIPQAWDGPGICILTGTPVILRLGSLDCTWTQTVLGGTPPLPVPMKNPGL